MKNAKMKKALSVLAVCALTFSLLAGCGAKTEEPAEPVGMPNPLTEITAEELTIPMAVPEGAADVHYFTLDDGSEALISQMTFTCDGHEYTFRAQPTAGFDAYDMSGLYCDSWDSAPDTIGYCDGIVLTISEAAGVYWLDVVPGINYTLGCSEAVSYDEILAMANAVFTSAQGEAEADIPETEIDSEFVMDFIPLGMPEAAENIEYCSEDGISEIQFDCSGVHYVCRAEATSEFEAYDMSGVELENPEAAEVSVSYCDAAALKGENASVIYWLDVVPGVNYTLSCDCSMAAEELAAVAEECFQPMQGEVDGDYVELAGLYTDEDSCTIELTPAEDGTYTVEISIVRLSAFEGTANPVDGAAEFVVEDPNGGQITGIFFPEEDGTWTLSFTGSEWSLLEAGTVFQGFVPAE